MTITITIAKVDTEPMLDAQAMALLFGVDVAMVNALPISEGTSPIPREWIRRGRQRSKEAAAHTGSDFILDVLQFWAQRDHGADLEVVYQ